MSSLTIVSNRLPVTVKKVDGELVFEQSSGGLATAMSTIEAESIQWVGWPGIASDELSAVERRTITRELKKRGCTPVFLAQCDIELFYEGYANDTLWPLFHYFQNMPRYRTDYWQAYQKVNATFARAVFRISDSSDTIWIQDYQLMLLPRMLRDKLPEALIGFFLHIPFPSYELFRNLPERQAILEGLLGADLIGFHIYDYARHFLSSCLRILGLSNTNGRIAHHGRHINVDAFPIGIDYQKFRDALKTPEVASEIRELEQHYHDQKIILSVDRLDYTKGIPERLEAYGRFLADHPEYHKKVVLVMVAVPSRTEVESYQRLRDDVEQTVSRINGTYGSVDWAPISYQFQNVPFEHLVALYDQADVTLVTPLRDGMNLVAKEFVACQTTHPGVLILSEMTGAHEELAEAIAINPHDITEVSQAIESSLRMKARERKTRMQAMQQRIGHYTAQEWARDFLGELTRVNQEPDGALDAAGKSELVQQFHHAKKRLLLLDYDGTLRSFVSRPTPSAAKPSATLKETLAKLTALPETKVVIISGRTKDALQSWFGALPLDLVAEHGAWYRQNGAWNAADVTLDGYRTAVVALMKQYAARTPGAVVEEKDFALVWHYRQVPPELAYVRSTNLRHELKSLLEGSDLAVFSGHKVIEVKPKTVDKGTVAAEYERNTAADFTLIAGDDYTDEMMFEAARENTITIKVGEGDTAAHSRVKNVDSFVRLLDALLGDM